MVPRLQLPPVFVLLLRLLPGLGCAASALAFTGADDFGGGSSKWAYFFRRTDSLPNNGLLTFSGSRLDFTKTEPGAGSYFLGWDGDPASTASRVSASYTTDWVMEATVTNTAVAPSNPYATVGMEVASGPGSYTALMVVRRNGGTWLRVETNTSTNGTDTALSANSDVRLRIAWSAGSRNLTLSYSLDGVRYTTAAIVPVSRWPTAPTAGFYFEVYGNSILPAAIPAGQMYLDNFSVTAQRFTGSDDFSGTGAKWAYSLRPAYLTTGTNGVFTFNGATLEFTKGADKGSQIRGWDGDGISGNDLVRIPSSGSTSWVMDATVTNLHVPEAGTFAGIGIEAVPAAGKYAEITVGNSGGQLYVRAEVNAADDGTNAAIGSGANVRLRIAWDAPGQKLTLSYSADGITYNVLRTVPISASFPSPRDGFYFEAVGFSTGTAPVPAGVMHLDNFSIAAAPAFTAQPVNQTVAAGSAVTLSAPVSAGATIAWQQNGATIAGQTSATLTVPTVQPADSGVYQAVVSSAGVTALSDAAIVGVSTDQKVIGTGSPVGPPDIRHANGNIFDQVLLEGPAASITADPQQITRMSYIDRNDDIVQVEFSGKGTVTVLLDNASAPALPVNYNQAVNYVKGTASIIVTGADETTWLAVFTVGRGTAVNQALFRDEVVYDGLADIAFIAISSSNGRFGGLRTANVRFAGDRGITGVYAPGVTFSGPVYVGDIDASGTATPVLKIGSAADTRITGGDLRQTNGRAVQVSGLAQLQFTAGSTSHYVAANGDSGLIPAQANQAVLEENGTDVTAEIVGRVNP